MKRWLSLVAVVVLCLAPVAGMACGGGEGGSWSEDRGEGGEGGGFHLVGYKAGWRSIDDRPYLGVEFTVESAWESEARYICVRDADGVKIRCSDIALYTSGPGGTCEDVPCTCWVPMVQEAHYGENWLTGIQCELAVKDWDGNTLFSKNLSFDGPEVVVERVSVTQEEFHYIEEIAVHMTITVKNKGDLPAHMSRVEITIDGEPRLMTFVLHLDPHEEDSYGLLPLLISPGQKITHLVIKDSDGNVMCSYSPPMPLP